MEIHLGGMAHRELLVILAQKLGRMGVGIGQSRTVWQGALRLDLVRLEPLQRKLVVVPSKIPASELLDHLGQALADFPPVLALWDSIRLGLSHPSMPSLFEQHSISRT